MQTNPVENDPDLPTPFVCLFTLRIGSEIVPIMQYGSGLTFRQQIQLLIDNDNEGS